MFFLFFFNDTATTEIYTLSLHDALPILCRALHHAEAERRQLDDQRLLSDPRRGPERLDFDARAQFDHAAGGQAEIVRSEEHTAELQSQSNIVCRLLLVKKNKH